METKPQKLLAQVREAIRMKHYSYRTEQAYVDWIKRFILSHSKRHPKEMAAEEVQGYISYLANERKVAASTHTALVVGARGTSRPGHLPTVLSHQEALAVIRKMTVHRI